MEHRRYMKPSNNPCQMPRAPSPLFMCPQINVTTQHFGMGLTILQPLRTRYHLKLIVGKSHALTYNAHHLSD